VVSSAMRTRIRKELVAGWAPLGEAVTI